MSQEDIYEVERMEKDALASHAWMQENPEPLCASCKDCYSEKNIFPCNDCNVLDSNKSISRYVKHKARR